MIFPGTSSRTFQKFRQLPQSLTGYTFLSCNASFSDPHKSRTQRGNGPPPYRQVSVQPASAENGQDGGPRPLYLDSSSRHVQRQRRFLIIPVEATEPLDRPLGKGNMPTTFIYCTVLVYASREISSVIQECLQETSQADSVQPSVLFLDNSAAISIKNIYLLQLLSSLQSCPVSDCYRSDGSATQNVGSSFHHQESCSAQALSITPLQSPKIHCRYSTPNIWPRRTWPPGI